MTDKRYKLWAYVCQSGKVTWQHYEGVLDFRQVFTKRPAECRYAIIQEGDEYIAADLYEAAVDLERMTAALGERRVFADLDAAIMSCVLTYDKACM